jgi:hypothetical protein
MCSGVTGCYGNSTTGATTATAATTAAEAVTDNECDDGAQFLGLISVMNSNFDADSDDPV